MDDNILAPQEVEKKGQEIYSNLKTRLESEFMGKYVAIEVESSRYFVGDTIEEVITTARREFPNKIFHLVKIGSEGVFKASGYARNKSESNWLF